MKIAYLPSSSKIVITRREGSRVNNGAPGSGCKVSINCSSLSVILSLTIVTGIAGAGGSENWKAPAANVTAIAVRTGA